MLNNNAATFSELFRSCAEQYGDMPIDSIYSAFSRTGWGTALGGNPFIQNKRVKDISSLPVEYTRGELAKMLVDPNNNELPLRQVSSVLESSAYPYYKIRKTYQDILSYHFYSYPAFLEKEEAASPEFLREWRLVEKLSAKLHPKQCAHMICGQCVRDGKVFYVPRLGIDKSHNSVNHAFLQQLPQDYTKISGLNNINKYCVSFNLMYFMLPGTDWRQFGNLFEPYLRDFNDAIIPMENDGASKLIFASAASKLPDGRAFRLKIEGAKELSRKAAGQPEIYAQNGKWFYWVTLPPEKVWSFEIDDVSRNVITPLTGLMLAMIDIASYESVQLNLVANPLVSVVLGEIPLADNKDASDVDPYKVSPSGRSYFEALWYQMLAANNTSGVGMFAAPFEHMQLAQLAEAPNATKVSATGYSSAMMKSGLNAIIPVTDEPRAGSANISLQLESRYAESIYRTFENMMDYIYSELKLKWDWRFHMFGSLATDAEDLKSAKEGATLGILSENFRYNALLGHSVLDDISMSRAIDALGVLDLRKPLITSYSAKNENGLPPQPGRPPTEGAPTSEGNEGDMDI